MKNPILSFILVFCILCGYNVFGQAIDDDIYSIGKTRTILKSKIEKKANEADINSIGTIQPVSMSKKEDNIKKTQYLILGGMAIHPSQNSGLVMLGSVKTFGGYLKVKTDLNYDESFAQNGKSTDSRYFTSETQKGRYAVTGGILWRVFSPLLLYGGFGYGNRWVNWKTVSGETFRVTDISYQGVELETGLILKIQKLVFSGGLSVSPFNYLEANIGVGIMFGIPSPKIKAAREKAAHGGKR